MDNSVPVDENYIEKSFSDISIFLNYLNNIKSVKLTESNKSKLNNIFEKLSYLISYYDSCDKKGYQQYKIDNSLWEGDILLKYLFEDCITYTNFKQQYLYCTVCNIQILKNSDSLLMHLRSCNHLNIYAANENGWDEIVWGNFTVEKLAYKKYMELTYEGIYCKLCCTKFPFSNIHLIGHINSKEHFENFRSIVNFKFEFDKQFVSSSNNLPVGKRTSKPQTNLNMSSNKLGGSFTNETHCKSENLNPNTSIKYPGQKEHHEIIKPHFEQKLKILNTAIEQLLDVLSKPSQDIILSSAKADCFGFFCSPCQYWTTKTKNWNKHNKTDLHVKSLSSEPSSKIIHCDCNILLYCDDEFYNIHVSSNAHYNLKSVTSFKLNSTVPSDDIDSKTVLCMTKSNISSTVINDVFTSPSNSSGSDHLSLRNGASMLKSDSKIKSKDTKLRIGKENEETRDEKSNDDKCTTSFWLGLTGLPSDISDNDIQQAFKIYGEVVRVNKLEDSKLMNTSKVDVLIKFREKWSDKIVDIVKNHKVQIRRASYPIRDQQSRVFNIPGDIQQLFSQNLFQYKLYLNIKKNSKITKNVFGEELLYTTIIDKEIKKVQMFNKVTTIGSRAIGLADEDSWFDFFVDVDGIPNEPLTVEQKKEYGNQIKTNMARLNSLFKNVRIDGNCVVCTLCETEATCRIYFCDKIVISNIELIGVYVEGIELEFVKTLLVTIRYWVKCCNLKDLVSSYAVTWMVLHYLISTSFVRQVKFLKDNYIGEKITISGWDCGFDRRTSILSTDSRSKSFKPLLKGFFEFYSSHEIYFNVLTPLTGRSIKKSKFQVNVSKDKPPFRLTEGLCLQDPIELCINLTENLNGENLNRFKSLCSIMIDFLAEKL